MESLVSPEKVFDAAYAFKEMDNADNVTANKKWMDFFI